MEDEINLLDYWRVIVKFKQIIIWTTILGGLLALIYGVRQPKMFKATTSIMVVESGAGGLSSALSSFGFGGGAGMSGGEGKITPILKSNSLAKQVASNLDLNKYFPKMSEKISNESEIIGSVAGSLRGAVEAKSAEGLLNVSINWPKPDEAAELANTYVKQLGVYLNSHALNVNFQVIDPAVPPRAPYNKNTKNNVMIGLLAGIFAGTLIAFLLEYREKIVHQS